MLSLLNFKLSKSFFNNFINKAIGVTTKKNIKPITKGEINFPNNRPNLNQILFKGDNKLEFIIPKIKKIVAIARDHNLTLSPLNNG